VRVLVKGFGPGHFAPGRAFTFSAPFLNQDGGS
jgi:hypothetical protein